MPDNYTDELRAIFAEQQRHPNDTRYVTWLEELKTKIIRRTT